ncbi:Nucleoside diphosphate kinase B [Exaiptasia diaphana]|nr:Nucleoside diphosphate kinase B [Exaiptasia diaphana]
MAEANRERTFLMIKPDAVSRGLIGKIVSRFEKKGFKLVAMKFVKKSEEHFRKHYESLKHLKFYDGLCKYMSETPVVAMVWEGLNVVKTARQMLGETDPAKSNPGTIRGDYSIHIGRGYYMGARRYGFYLRVLKRSLTSERSECDHGHIEKKISFTAATQLQVQMMKSTFGLHKMSLWTGFHVAIHGCMNKQQ